jgi:hypothetical protein
MDPIIKVAIGPKLPEFGSWNWLGEGLTENLRHPFLVEQFRDIDHPPAAEIVVFIKFVPKPQLLATIARRSKIVYLPVDVYGDCREIDGSFESMRSMSKVIVNSRRLRRYFAGYCEVEYIDHPLKFSLPSPRLTNECGPLVWIGQICNITPVVEWVNSQSLERELWVLTNLNCSQVSARSLGFVAGNIRVENWGERRHMEYLDVASVAIDIKGNDFRARHKPPAKTLDFLASGIPVITNRGSSVDLHLQQLGGLPLYTENWQEQLTDGCRLAVYEFAERMQAKLNPVKVWDSMRRSLLALT